MQKVYLLLRHNQQTGPYSLEEILQFDLKPYDLIWIEGRSAGWYYPQEIQALQPHLSFLKQTTTPPIESTVPSSFEKPSEDTSPKKVFVSMPFNAVKEEPTPRPSFASVTNTPKETSKPLEPVTPPKAVEEVKTSYSKSLQDVETDYMNWMYQKKTAKKTTVSAKGAAAACLIVGIAFAGWVLLKPSGETPVETTPEQTAFLPAQNELPADGSTDEESATKAAKTSTNKKAKQAKGKVVLAETTKPSKQRTQKIAGEEVVMNASQKNDNEVAPEIVEEKDAEVIERKSETVTTETPKEKKKLREKIADLFKKKPEENKEEAKPVEEEEGERRAVRREAGSNLVQMVNVRFNVPNDWMMGIKGAKATLTNRSSETIAKAVIEVVYYNDENDVLDKRTVSFGNIKSKQTQTVSIPDHQTATRLEYNVISATGAGEPFAKR